MNAVLLAAGYGTRLRPLTLDRPKSLLPVGGKPILEHLVERLDRAPGVGRIVLVTNDRFADQFERWAARRHWRTPFQMLSDGSTGNEERLGAVADIALAVERADLAGQAAYVMATDNLPRFDFMELVGLWRSRGASAVFVCAERDGARLRRCGVAELDAAGRLVRLEEKPARPRSNLRVPPFYLYAAADLARLAEYLREGGNRDAPGHFLAWLAERSEVFTLRRDEGTYDIGTLESYRAVCEDFERGGRDSLDGSGDG